MAGPIDDSPGSEGSAVVGGGGRIRAEVDLRGRSLLVELLRVGDGSATILCGGRLARGFLTEFRIPAMNPEFCTRVRVGQTRDRFGGAEIELELLDPDSATILERARGLVQQGADEPELESCDRRAPNSSAMAATPLVAALAAERGRRSARRGH